MPPKKTPNNEVTRDQIMSAGTLGDFLTLKLDQLGLTQLKAASAMGFSGPVKLANILSGRPDATGYGSEKINALITLFETEHSELGLESMDFEQQARLKYLNDQLPKTKGATSNTKTSGKRLSPDETITREALLKTDNFADFIEQKRRQLGVVATRIGQTMGSTYSPTIFKETRKLQFPPEHYDLLCQLFTEQSGAVESASAFDETEKAHMDALHSKLKPRKAPKAKTPEKDVEGAYSPLDLVHAKGKRVNGSCPEFHALTHIMPSEKMIKALKTKNPDMWNTEKAAVLGSNPKAQLYLCGVDMSTGFDLRGFDMSHCDLSGAFLPRDPRMLVPESLKKATLMQPQKDGEQKYLNSLPMSLRRKFESDNPDFKAETLNKKAPNDALFPESGAVSADSVEMQGMLIDAPAFAMAR